MVFGSLIELMFNEVMIICLLLVCGYDMAMGNHQSRGNVRTAGSSSSIYSYWPLKMITRKLDYEVNTFTTPFVVLSS